MRYVLSSPLTVTECQQRLTAALAAESARPWRTGGPRPIVGQVNGDRFRIYQRRWRGNAFSLHGQWQPQAAGTWIIADYRLNPFPLIFIGGVVGFGILTICVTFLFAVPLMVLLLTTIGPELRQAAPDAYYAFLSVPLLLLAFPAFWLLLGAIVAGMSVGLSRIMESETPLLAFLARTLKARPVTQSSPTGDYPATSTY